MNPQQATPIVIAFFTLACEHEVASPPIGAVDESAEGTPLSFAERQEVSAWIRDVAFAKGITNAVVIAGVANQETNLVHCYRDASWHCAGPHADSCGGAVLAGSGDGPCNIRQGGLGMFQLDAGTHGQTVATYGAHVVELDGNIDAGIEIIIHKVEICPNTPVFANRDEVIAWINGAIPGTAEFDVFHHAMASCYNGCTIDVCGVALHNERMRGYRDSSLSMLEEMGVAFWFPAPVEPIDPATMSCGDYAAAVGYAEPACEWNRNGACGALGPATNDCDHCCDWAALPFAPPPTGEMSCGEYADHVGFVNPQCEWNGNGACDGVGAQTWDCDACCDRP